jgi:hypothetical protein
MLSRTRERRRIVFLTYHQPLIELGHVRTRKQKSRFCMPSARIELAILSYLSTEVLVIRFTTKPRGRTYSASR